MIALSFMIIMRAFLPMECYGGSFFPSEYAQSLLPPLRGSIEVFQVDRMKRMQAFFPPPNDSTPPFSFYTKRGDALPFNSLFCVCGASPAIFFLMVVMTHALAEFRSEDDPLLLPLD